MACVFREFSTGDACFGCILANSLPLPGLCFECSGELCERHAKAIPFALRPAFKIASALLRGLMDR